MTKLLAAGLLAIAGLASAGEALPGQEPAPTPIPVSEASVPGAPGWYRLQLGRLRVTALLDGTLQMPVHEVFPQPSRARLDALLARDGLPATVTLPVIAYVIDDGRTLTLVDAGTGDSRMFGGALGHVPARLHAAGYAPEHIDQILLTHMHTDHVGGLSSGGVALYPRAVVRAARREAEQFLDPARLALPEGEREDYASAQAMLAPYVAAGRFETFDGTARFGAVQARPAPGHTAGHTVYVVDGGAGARLVLWGDLLHVAPVQLPDPSATVSFEFDRRRSAVERRRLLRELARDGDWIGAAHLGFPGIGRLRPDGRGGYRWLPISMIEGR